MDKKNLRQKRMLLVVKLFAWIAASLFAVNVSAEHESGKWDCAGSQMDMNFCAAASFKHVDDDMNALYRQQLARLEVAATKARLRDAQRAWLVFRDKSCLYDAGPLENSGSIWALEHYGCMERHTKQRIDDLKVLLQCTQNGCPN